MGKLFERNAFAVGGLTCAVCERSFSGTEVVDVELSLHHLVSLREVSGEGLRAHGAFDGGRFVTRRMSEFDLFFLPAGHRWAGTFSGSAGARFLMCDLDPSIFKSVLGDRAGFDLEPYFGESRIAPGILERLEALCMTPDAFPRAYADALTTVLTFELFRARSNKPFSPNQAQFGASRFKPVLDHIEGVLESDPSLSDLASLMGLSVSHFSHAFTAAYGVAPHRYILQRRIEKAKALLRTSDATVATISARVGFSSQSRFSQIFARHTGITPSAYRMRQHKEARSVAASGNV
jgi:AraC family transcriptional regulator